MAEHEKGSTPGNNQTIYVEIPSASQSRGQSEGNKSAQEMPDIGGIALKSLFWPAISWMVNILRDIGKNMPSIDKVLLFLGTKMAQLDDRIEETLVKITGISMEKILLGNWHVRIPYIEMLYILTIYTASHFLLQMPDGRESVKKLVLFVVLFLFLAILLICRVVRKGYMSPTGLLTQCPDSWDVVILANTYSAGLCYYPVVLDILLKFASRYFSFPILCLIFFVMNVLVFVMLCLLNSVVHNPGEYVTGLMVMVLAMGFLILFTRLIIAFLVYPASISAKQSILKYSAVPAGVSQGANTTQKRAGRTNPSCTEQQYRIPMGIKTE